ncbi:vacuolar calcium ion transporter [Colletotrichum spaethianum]|uniref:Vacuolar calcium ion transporter n=1 Tax=Colletotrichum spaethianum TaxID=700344 RepID=A0AA37LAL1_9PEZI|nr:vacuolar calcium ion transporter [Colletotrichum spaethianum]GKT43079.1 vacuolar calcium ion transporter [Colletotrichum spaethianum]
MKKASPDPPNIDSVRSGAPGSAHGAPRSPSNRSDDAGRPTDIITDLPRNLSSKSSSFLAAQRGNNATTYTTASTASRNHGAASGVSPHHIAVAGSSLGYPDGITDKTSPRTFEDVAASKEASRQGPLVGDGAVSSRETSNKPSDQKPKIPVFTRFYLTCKMILFHSWVNVLLVFVPIGIVVEALHLNPGIVFAMNAIAIIPLAGLLSHATESVASKLGDTIGALLNVTFGNAVELIIL